MISNKKMEKNIPVDYLEDTDELNQGKKEKSGKESSGKTSKSKDKYKLLYEESVKKYEDLNEQFLRFRAEFANYKKRVEREQIEFTAYIKGEIIKKLLPVVDDFSHMIIKSGEGGNEESVLEGAKMIYNKFHQILESEGLEKIEAVGEEFDPQIHEALMMQKINEQEKHNKIISVFQEGYKIKERLLRPSKVIVGNFEDDEANKDAV